MSTDSNLRQFIAPTDPEIRRQLSTLLIRRAPEVGRRQVNFTPVEVLLCLAAARVVRWNRYGGNNAHTAPSPVPELAYLFRRSPGSILSKMGNLLGGRAHGGSQEVEAADWYGEDQRRLDRVYDRVLTLGREAGIDEASLPDFMPQVGGPR